MLHHSRHVNLQTWKELLYMHFQACCGKNLVSWSRTSCVRYIETDWILHKNKIKSPFCRISRQTIYSWFFKMERKQHNHNIKCLVVQCHMSYMWAPISNFQPWQVCANKYTTVRLHFWTRHTQNCWFRHWKAGNPNLTSYPQFQWS